MTLDKLETRLWRIDSAVEYLREFDHDHENAGQLFVLDHLADDLDAILDQMHRLVFAARLAEMRKGKGKAAKKTKGLKLAA